MKPTDAVKLARLVRTASEARKDAERNRGDLDLGRVARRAEKARDDFAHDILRPPQTQPELFGVDQ